MVSSNSSHLELKVLDTSFPLDVIKSSSLIDSPHLPPSISTSFTTLHHLDNKSSQSRSMVKLLNNIDSSPESSPRLSLHKLSGSRLKKISDLSQNGPPKKSPNHLKKSLTQYKDPSIKESHLINAPETFRKHTGHTKKPHPIKDQNFQKVDNGTTTAKRHLEPSGIEDVLRKKIHNENAEETSNPDEELEAFNFIKVLDIEVDDDDFNRKNCVLKCFVNEISFKQQ